MKLLTFFRSRCISIFVRFVEQNKYVVHREKNAVFSLGYTLPITYFMQQTGCVSMLQASATLGALFHQGPLETLTPRQLQESAKVRPPRIGEWTALALASFKRHA